LTRIAIFNSILKPGREEGDIPPEGGYLAFPFAGMILFRFRGYYLSPDPLKADQGTPKDF